MSSPLFLTLDQIILFHRKGLDLFGGTDGMRDEGALQGAVAQSLQVFFKKMETFLILLQPIVSILPKLRLSSTGIKERPSQQV